MKLEIFSSRGSDKVIYLVTTGVFLWIISYHLNLIISPIQQEYREGAQLILSKDFSQGIYPYSFASVPLDTNPYGIFYQLVSYYPVKAFGSTFLVHRALSSVFLIASLLIALTVLIKNEVWLPLSLTTISLIYVSLLFGSTPLARPDALGELLFLGAVFIPYLKKFNYPSLLASCGILFLIFFTKLYFVTAFFIVLLYLFIFISKKKSLIYGLLFSVVFATWLSISYFFTDVYINQVIGSMAKATSLSNAVLRLQLNFYFVSHLLVFILALMLTIRISKNKRKIFEKRYSLSPTILLNLRTLDKPLVYFQLSYLSFASLITFGLLCLIWGRNDGGWMCYFYQLLSPFLLIRIALLFNRNYRQIGAVVFLLNATLFFAIYFNTQSAIIQNKGWERVQELIKTPQNIYGSAAVSGILAQGNKKVYDTGLSLGSWASIYKPSGFEQLFQNKNEVIQNANEKYCNEILNQLYTHQFDLILMYGASIAFKESELQNYGYRKESVIPISFPHTFQSYNLSVWIPNDDAQVKQKAYKQCQVYQ
ncbi:hypothetical protein A8O14_01635 [Polynucleobacter wuianus]|uniref:Glycosyltransferase RgtA/B/C/D-like domain-containing protein n=1 Tax=Polynucleobacter wuianus TaxID=1743168 RepID=A0A191UCY5_9BURK|nr:MULTISPECIES: hypothetical protein [Polynucleobacter]ANI98908.1 hypothetical protein A8O14_01635 [Polynucleobacter wuianus]MBU3553731.1 hypothetical protein [Polynucleobacter sp. MWH-Post4-6-1]